MPDRTYNVDVATDTTLVTTAETVVATLPGVSLARPGGSVRFHGEVTVTTGAAVTGLIPRVRRASLTGAVVGESLANQLEVAAGSTEDHDYVTTDADPGEISGFTYVLTLQQVGGAANGTVLHASLEAVASP